MRLDKLLSVAGMTRTEAKRAVAAGRVQINGVPARDPGAHVKETDVLLDGRPVTPPGELYLMLNKPAGILTATKDARQPTVLSLLPEAYRKRSPSPVGRLDKDVTGLLFLTTDGQLAHRLISPRWAVEKRYRAEIEGAICQRDIEAFAQGLALSDFVARPAKLFSLGNGLAEVLVTEGKFHQVKRMFAAIGHPVIRLERLEMAGIALDPSLAPGAYRELSEEELVHLYQTVQLERTQ